MKGLKKDRTTRPEVCKEVWCLKWKGQGHDKDHCPIFVSYVAVGGPMPLRTEDATGPSTGPMLWCAIYQVVRKHVTDNCHLLQKFIHTPQKLFYNLCGSIGHDENNYCSYELMMDKTPSYKVQEETQPLDQGASGVQGEYQGRS